MRLGVRGAVVGAAIALHLLGLWALQAGLLQRVVTWVVPVMAVSEAVDVPVPPPPPAKRLPPPAATVSPRPTAPLATSASELPLAVPAASVPAESAPIGLPAPSPVQNSAPAAAAPVTATPAPSPKIALPSTQADYLNNPRPAYPALSRRLGEQGRAVVRVLIGADGLPQKAELHSSSGFERLDRAALDTVMRWRYVPGKRGDVPEAMWFNVPLNFVLE
jgi:periplasmic protein TonB